MAEPEASDEASQPNLFDLSMKTICRHAPAALLRLAGSLVDPLSIFLADVSVVLPEFRADQLLLIGDPPDPSRWGVHFEYQTHPNVGLLGSWLFKNSAFNRQLDR